MSAFALVVHIEIKPGAVERFMPLAVENAKATRETEPGCRQFDVLVDPADPTKVVYYEIYDDEAAFHAHQQTPHFKRYVATALEHLTSRVRTSYRRIAP
ncbi:MAG: antibiotic biosynthesis monooxygenase [Proteobacteria bacterium]|nr:MAG: antibiotic biosynthesis monooxygenase [Pseudomonadota bacterium]